MDGKQIVNRTLNYIFGRSVDVEFDDMIYRFVQVNDNAYSHSMYDMKYYQHEILRSWISPILAKRLDEGKSLNYVCRWL